LQDLITKKLSATAVTPSQRAITTRYEQVLRDVRMDFDRAKQQYLRYNERNELFSNPGGGANGASLGPNHDPAMDALLRERNSIQNSMNSASNVIGQAEAIRSELHGQGRSLRNTSNVMGQIMSHVPSLNNIIDAIRRRRSSDDKIVAIFIALCVSFILWYIFG
jgi:golgi SNAP receptor complex member 1